MRIAGFASLEGGSTQYRAYQPLQVLAGRGHEVLLNTAGDQEDPRTHSFDVAYVHRLADASAQRIVDRLHAVGVAVVWDIDDDVMSSELMSRGGLKAQRQRSAIERMARCADLVTTTRESLVPAYESLGAAHVRVVPNYLSPLSLDAIATSRVHAGVTIGWIAWMDHQEDWRRLGLQATVERLLDQHPELRVESVGPIDLGLPSDCYQRTGPLPFNELPAAIARFDIGIAPIADVPFNRSRSDIKLKEYAIAGVPWLASPIGPYADLGERQGGRLVPDDRWHDELERLVVDARARRKLGKRARKWALTQTLEKNAGAWEAAFREAIELRAAQR